MIKFPCEFCSTPLRAPLGSEGKKTTCPKCGTKQPIPQQTDEPVLDAESWSEPPPQPARRVQSSLPSARPVSLNKPPAPAKPASTGLDFDDDDDGVDYGLKQDPYGLDDAAEDARDDEHPCPMCGESIKIVARKCRFCGEILDSPTRRKRGSKRSRHSDDDQSILSPSDWLTGIVCPGVGAFMGFGYLIHGKPKGIKLLGLSVGAQIAHFVLSALLGILFRPR